MMSLTKSRVTRIILPVVGVVLLLWLFIPTTDIVTPDWTVLVTDTNQHAIAGASVTVFSQQYTLEHTDTEDTQITDAQGHVHFNERKIHATNLQRIFGVLSDLLGQGAHAGFGLHTHVHANKDGYGDPSKLELFSQNERESTANVSARQTSHIVLMQCSPGYSGFGCDFPNDPSMPVLPLQR
jgi:hypothetical protein